LAPGDRYCPTLLRRATSGIPTELQRVQGRCGRHGDLASLWQAEAAAYLGIATAQQGGDGSTNLPAEEAQGIALPSISVVPRPDGRHSRQGENTWDRTLACAQAFSTARKVRALAGAVPDWLQHRKLMQFHLAISFVLGVLSDAALHCYPDDPDATMRVMAHVCCVYIGNVVLAAGHDGDLPRLGQAEVRAAQAGRAPALVDAGLDQVLAQVLAPQPLRLHLDARARELPFERLGEDLNEVGRHACAADHLHADDRFLFDEGDRAVGPLVQLDAVLLYSAPT